MTRPPLQCASCRQPIRWTRTAANDRPMPVDHEPAPTGNVRVRYRANGGAVSTVLAGDKLAEARDLGERLYLSHFATCPNSNRHRKGKP